MSMSYIGSKISFISKSEIKYEGILYSVDLQGSTIALANVRTFGTENHATERPRPPRDVIFDYIKFKTTEIKNIVVCETPQPVPQLYDGPIYDPAILSMSKVNIAMSASGSESNLNWLQDDCNSQLKFLKDTVDMEIIEAKELAKIELKKLAEAKQIELMTEIKLMKDKQLIEMQKLKHIAKMKKDASDDELRRTKAAYEAELKTLKAAYEAELNFLKEKSDNEINHARQSADLSSPCLTILKNIGKLVKDYSFGAFTDTKKKYD